MIHLLIAGARIKSVRSHLSVADLGRLAARGARAAGPAPLPAGDAVAFEVDRVVNNNGLVGLGGHQVLAAEILGGRQVVSASTARRCRSSIRPRGSCCGCGRTR